MAEAVITERPVRAERLFDWLALNVALHWLLYVNVGLGLLVLAPFAAPVFMALGDRYAFSREIGSAIYSFYGLLCHQLPQRSFFLGGSKVSYSLEEIGRVWNYNDLFSLRQFVGNSVMGWKVAWSDRMVAMYGSFWLGGILFAITRPRNGTPTGKTTLPVLPWLLLGILPMGLDGATHTLNDILAGLSGTGFRDTNDWLRFLTGSVFPATFYAGDAVGSFNNLARLETGALFGFLTVWFIYPFIDWAMREMEQARRTRLAVAAGRDLGFVPEKTEE